MATEFVAHRDLLFAEKGGQEKRKLRVKVSMPLQVSRTTTGEELGEGAAMCRIVFDGLEIADIEVYGADTLQALSLASDIEGVIRRLSREYDFFWDCGEPYFD